MTATEKRFRYMISPEGWISESNRCQAAWPPSGMMYLDAHYAEPPCGSESPA